MLTYEEIKRIKKNYSAYKIEPATESDSYSSERTKKR